MENRFNGFSSDGRKTAEAVMRLRVVPEARKKLAGGEAQRNHRTTPLHRSLRPGGAREAWTLPSMSRLHDAFSVARLPSGHAPTGLPAGREVCQ